MDDFVSCLDPSQVRPVVEEDGRFLNLRFDMATLQSRMCLDDPDRLELAYTRTMMRCLAFNAAPASILMIGLGGGSLAKYCHRHLGGADITVVENNPHVIGLRGRFCVPPNGRRFRVLQLGGAEYLRGVRRQFEVILLDGFDFTGQAAELGTQAFYNDCRTALAPRGVLVANLDSDPECNAPLLARMQAAFGGVDSLLTDGGSNRVAFAAAPDVLRAAQVHGIALELRGASALDFPDIR